MATLKVLSIDAWRYDGGWNWNSWYKVGEVDSKIIDLKTRPFLAAMRNAGFIGDQSKGRVAVEDDGYNMVILDKNTREPLYAVEYGSAI